MVKHKLNNVNSYNDFKKFCNEKLFYYGPKNVLSLYSDEINQFGIDKKVIFDWFEEFYVREIKQMHKIIKNGCELSKDIDFDKLLLRVSNLIDIGFSISETIVKKIVDLICIMDKCHIKKNKYFKNFDKETTLWDVYFQREKLFVDIPTKYSFRNIVINDIKYLNIEDDYNKNKLEIPYSADSRFTGLLPYLWFSGQKQSYEKLFAIILKTSEKNLDICLPIPYFLYTFVSEYDRTKTKTILDLIIKLHKNNPFFNWDIPIGCFHKADCGKDIIDSIMLEDILRNKPFNIALKNNSFISIANVFENKDSLKRYFIDYYPKYNPQYFVTLYKDELECLGIKTRDVFDWADEYNYDQLQFYSEKINDYIEIRGKKFENPIFKDIYHLLELYYEPSNGVLFKIVELIKKMSHCKAIIDGNDSDISLLDLYLISSGNIKEDFVIEEPNYRILSDTKLLNPKKRYWNSPPPYPTNNRFGGFLACLYYKNEIDLYETMFEIVINKIKKYPFYFTITPLFLFSFCKQNDPGKCKLILELIDEMKKKHFPQYWNKNIIYSIYSDFKKEYKNISLDDLLKKEINE